jgi:general secretion pathway protein B
MSFILDALRRLEEKREPETAGEIIAVARGGPGPARRKALWPWFLIVILSVNLILIAGWYFLKGERGEDRPVSVSTEPLSPAGGAGAGRAASPVPPVPKVEKIGQLGPAPATEEPPIPPRGVKETPPPAISVPPADAAGEEPDTLPPFPGQDDGLAAGAEEGPAGPGEGDGPLAGETTGSRVTSFEELPEDLRKSLQDLKIVAHVYSDDPSFRLLSIGEGLRREGETVRPGLLLEEILPDGAVFRYGRYRFPIDAN